MTRSPFSTAILTAVTDSGMYGALTVLSLGLGIATVIRASTSSFRRPAESFASTLIECHIERFQRNAAKSSMSHVVNFYRNLQASQYGCLPCFEKLVTGSHLQL